MVFTFLFEISDLWRHLAIFFNIFKIKANVPFIGFSVKNWIILTIFSQNSTFFEVLHELMESIWKEFWAKIPVCSSFGSSFLFYRPDPVIEIKSNNIDGHFLTSSNQHDPSTDPINDCDVLLVYCSWQLTEAKEHEHKK